jgi:hypothetical protein
VRAVTMVIRPRCTDAPLHGDSRPLPRPGTGRVLPWGRGPGPRPAGEPFARRSFRPNTAPLDNDWLVSTGVNLGSLPKGVQSFAGVKFAPSCSRSRS